MEPGVRSLAAMLAVASALTVGLVTVCLVARNRSRAAELDRLQRWCELLGRQNKILAVENRTREAALLAGDPLGVLPADAPPPNPLPAVER